MTLRGGETIRAVNPPDRGEGGEQSARARASSAAGQDGGSRHVKSWLFFQQQGRQVNWFSHGVLPHAVCSHNARDRLHNRWLCIRDSAGPSPRGRRDLAHGPRTKISLSWPSRGSFSVIDGTAPRRQVDRWRRHCRAVGRRRPRTEWWLDDEISTACRGRGDVSYCRKNARRRLSTVTTTGGAQARFSRQSFASGVADGCCAVAAAFHAPLGRQAWPVGHQYSPAWRRHAHWLDRHGAVPKPRCCISRYTYLDIVHQINWNCSPS